MELKEMEAALEAVLFAAGEPVGVERLCLSLESDRPTVDAVAQRLIDRYSYERRGVRLLRLPRNRLLNRVTPRWSSRFKISMAFSATG